MAKDTLTITDNRTGKNYEISIQNGTIRSIDLRQIKISEDDFGLMGYDPAFMNTASCQSKITFVDGEKGILRYRGYPIEELAEKSTYLETAYLILYGELPTQAELDRWKDEIRYHTYVHTNVTKFLELARAQRTNQVQRRVNVDFPSWMIRSLDKEADRLGVTRQSIIKVWISERLKELA